MEINKSLAITVARKVNRFRKINSAGGVNMKRTFILSVIISILGTLAFCQSYSVPNAFHYQGQLREGNIRYEGTGIFHFAIIDNTTPLPLILWSNDGSQVGKTADNIPVNGVTLTVSRGLFDVMLGDSSLPNMTIIPVSLFQQNKTAYLRVWFQKTSMGSIDLLSPDAWLVSVPFAFRAGSLNGKDIDDASIPMGKLGRESVAPENEGRSNTIQSIYFDITSSSASKVIYTVPTGKTFVITDIFIMAADVGAIWTITDDTSSQLTQYFMFQIDGRSSPSLQNWSHSFRSGLRFVAPQVVAIFPQGATQNLRIRGTIAGFEF